MQAGQVIKTLNEHLELSSSKDAEVDTLSHIPHEHDRRLIRHHQARPMQVLKF